MTEKNTTRVASRHANTLVRIKRYDPEKHLVDIVRESDGQPLEPPQTTTEPINQNSTYNYDDRRILKLNDNPEGPAVEVNLSGSRLTGNSTDGFYASKESGNVIMGPLSLATMPNQIRLGGITTLNPLLVTGFPSTVVSPLPVCMINLPGISSIKMLQRAVTTMATLISMCGS